MSTHSNRTSSHNVVEMRPTRLPIAIDAAEKPGIPEEDLPEHLGLFLSRGELAHILFLEFLFRQVVAIEGSVLDFGDRWGRNLAILSALRGLYDPWNRRRPIVGFGSSEKTVDVARPILGRRIESDSPNLRAPIEIRAGEPVSALEAYLGESPRDPIALACFDLADSAATRACVERIAPRIKRNAVLGFCDLTEDAEASAAQIALECLGEDVSPLRRLPICGDRFYLVANASSSEAPSGGL